MSSFVPSSRQNNRAKVAFYGPSKSGKTFTGLTLSFALARDAGSVFVIDSENGRSQLYHGLEVNGLKWEWQHASLKPGQYSPKSYLVLLHEAIRSGASVVLIDSITHLWAGTGGALEMKSQLDSGGGNSWANWSKIKPKVVKFFEAVVAAPVHVICTMRSNTEWEAEKDSDGKVRPQKIGLKPIIMPNTEYEFDMVCSMDGANTMTVETRFLSDLNGELIPKPSYESFDPYIKWLAMGSPVESLEKFESVLKSYDRVESKAEFAPGESTGPAPTRPTAPQVDSLRYEIITLVKHIGWAPTVFREKILQPAGVAKLADLTPNRLEQLKARLQAKVTKDEAAQSLQ
jgi:hypothetical protein